MGASGNAAIGRLAAVSCGLTLLLVSANSFGDTWPNDVQFVSEESAPVDDGAGSCDDCEHCRTACCSPCNSGYCIDPPCARQMACRMAAMAKSMEASGCIYDADVSQFYQGVTSGGADTGFEYGGKIDQFVLMDSTKLGLWQGGTMTLHAETRFGDDINFAAVGFAPANVAMLYPKEGENSTAITGLLFTQALDERVQLAYGKFNALDLWYGLYPETGRGVNGFMNASMVIPLAVARTVSLSFLGAGAMIYDGKKPQGGVLVYDTHNCTTTSGFEDLGDNGANILGFWRFFTDVNGLPGSQTFGSTWSTGKFVAFDPTGFVIVPGQGVVVNPQHGAYSLFYIFEQTLWQDCAKPTKNMTVLSQWALADEETSPVGWSANVGVQANGFYCARPNDSMGVGYFHTGVSSDLKNLLSPTFTLGDVDGVETYYNVAVTRFFNLTTDFQVIEPADARNDTAVVFGLRGTVGM